MIMVSLGQHGMVIRPKSRTPADEYVHKGRTWIEGRENSNYVVDLTNQGVVRCMAVLSVDGLSVCDGQPASYASTGFVIKPGETVTVPGWLVNNATAAEFVFASRKHSYAQHQNNNENVGVIGAAWFVEHTVGHSVARTMPVTTVDQTWAKSSAMGPVAVCASAHLTLPTQFSNHVQSMGTGFGEATQFATSNTVFVRSSSKPVAVSLIYYDSATNLQKMGIQMRSRAKHAPDAFPMDSGYCKPPPKWAARRW
jgi:hypothetical protein